MSRVLPPPTPPAQLPTPGPAGAAPPASRRSRARRTLRAGLSVAVAAALLFGVLPQVADLRVVAATLLDLPPGWVALLLAGAAWNIATYQFVMMAALPGLSMGRAFVAGQLSTAIANTLPAGAVVGVGATYTVLRSFGHDTERIAVAAAITGLWNTFVKLGLPIVAFSLLAVWGDDPSGVLAPALFGLAILIVTVVVGSASLADERIARRTGALAGAAVSRIRSLVGAAPVEGLDDRLAGFQRRSSDLLRRRWLLVTGVTLLSHLSLFAMLLVSLRAVGVGAGEVTALEALAVFATVRLVTALPITPGGLGIVEVGMVAALVVAGGPQTPVVAAVLLYRSLTYFLQVPLGLCSWVIWRRHAGTDGGTPPATPALDGGR